MNSCLHVKKFSEHCGISFIGTSCLNCLEAEVGIQSVLAVRATETDVRSKQQEPKGLNFLTIRAPDG